MENATLTSALINDQLGRMDLNAMTAGKIALALRKTCPVTLTEAYVIARAIEFVTKIKK